MGNYPCWGNYPHAEHEVRRVHWRHRPIPWPDDDSRVLPRGLGRSYGDSCLNDGGVLIDATPLDRLLEFDPSTGLLRAEAGVSLAAILEVAVPRGWFLPVTPGTKFVTLGGAVANDIHGKNHHRAGTLGCFVDRFEIARSDGRRLVCSRHENSELFRATIGGLGLTGLLTWVELRMKRVAGPLIDVECVRFEHVGEFFELARQSDEAFDYTVAWIDSTARGESLGRGHFLRGSHASAAGPGSVSPAPRAARFRVPVHAPGSLLNGWTLRAFNAAYFHRQRRRLVRRTTHYDPFFYPLDVIDDWNLLYGRRGFVQYQCVVPREAGEQPIRDLLGRIAASGESSFLAVMKVFGDVESPGLLSFPMPGVTLALDFPLRGRSTLELLDELDREVMRHGGRVYPAKDARMSAHSFQRFFPDWRQMQQHIDPRFSSGLWRRVTAESA